MSGVWAILQATIGQTSEGTWIRRTVISPQVWDSTDTTLISQSDHGETAGDCAAVKTMGEGSNIPQGAREGTTGLSTAEEDGEEESVGKERNGQGTTTVIDAYVAHWWAHTITRHTIAAVSKRAPHKL